MIKLVATDIDGTLLQSGEREVPEAVFVQIDRLLKKEYYLRQRAQTVQQSEKSVCSEGGRDEFLCENGAILYRKIRF